jgi:hypothetical protein
MKNLSGIMVILSPFFSLPQTLHAETKETKRR